MALQIRIVPVALHEAAQRQKSIIQTMSEASDQLGALAAELGDAWEGSASVQALNSLDDLRKAAGDIYEAGSDSHEKLSQIAKAFESVDDGDTIGIRVLPYDNRMKVLTLLPSNFPFMISDNLRIVPDQVRSVAEECKKLAETYRQLSADTLAMLSDLEKNWEGNSYNRFADQTNDISEAFQKLGDSLQEFAERITLIANRYEELDNML